MKILSVFMSVLLILSMCLTANAAETDAPVMRYLGDANLDGSITAADARLILRTAVGLDNVPADRIIYCDCDFDGNVGASDARFALRSAVDLEEKQSYSFEITESKEATCSEEGYTKGKCTVTGKEVSVTVKKLPHSLPDNIGCAGKGKCTVCGEEIAVEINHEYINDYENDTKKCALCGYKAPLNHVHSFNSHHICECSKDAKTVFQEDITKYLKKYGGRGEGYYYADEYIEPLTFALFYEDRLGFSYAYCGFAVDAEGMILYYDFNYDFEDGTVEAVLYADDTEVVYAYGKINPSKVNEAADGDAITLQEYIAIPELNGMEKELRIMMEGAVHDTVQWLRVYAKGIGFTYADHVFADFVNVK